SCGLDAMSAGDLWKRRPELRRHDATVTSARAPTNGIRIEYGAVDAALLQCICRGQAGITGSDNRHIDAEILRERRALANGRIRDRRTRSHRAPERVRLRPLR